jgi:hypothetical protein
MSRRGGGRGEGSKSWPMMMKLSAKVSQSVGAPGAAERLKEHTQKDLLAAPFMQAKQPGTFYPRGLDRLRLHTHHLHPFPPPPTN